MYKQSIKNIKVVIIPFDGTILDLNRLRYNYYHHLCNDKNIEFSKHEFYSHLSNMYDMYKGLPLSNRIDNGPLNAKIERELFQYLKHKGIKPKEGFDELLEWFLQKEIKIAVISTHRTKDAVQYLQMTKIYNKVHYIIGSDTVSSPLPSTQILKNIVDEFQVNYQEVLVLSSFMSLNNAANQMHMNVIYCQDLIKADRAEEETSYKVVTNLFEVLNTLLFDRYNDVEIYSPILGMNEHMDKEQLDEVRDKLHQSYENDSQLINIVDQTYQYHINQLNQVPTQVKKPVAFNESPRFHFNDEIINQEESQVINIEELAEEPIEDHQMHESMQELNLEDQETLTLLLNQINKKDGQAIETPKVTDFEEIKDIVVASHQDDEEKEPSILVSFMINALYTISISLLVLFFGLIINIAFIHQFQSGTGVFGFIANIFNGYYSIIEFIFKSFFDGLHSLIRVVPTYQDYLFHNAIFSSDGVKFFNIFLFQFLIIGIVKIIIYYSNRGSHNENTF